MVEYITDIDIKRSNKNGGNNYIAAIFLYMLDLFAYETLNDFPALNVALDVILFNLQSLLIVVPCILAILPSVSPFDIR